jgi:hypothetical protein
MTEIQTIEPQIELSPKDPIEVIAGASTGGGRPWPFDPQPRSSFEIAWELAH